jgi:hypothetical protein
MQSATRKLFTHEGVVFSTKTRKSTNNICLVVAAVAAVAATAAVVAISFMNTTDNW